MLTGYKTYIAAGLAFAGALYYIVVADDVAKGFELIVAALGLAGLRNALNPKQE